MKKLTLALAITALSLSTSAFAEGGAPTGTQGQVKFEGLVTAAGCSILAGNNGTINLGSVSKKYLKTNSSSEWTEGQIKFVDCNLDEDAGKVASVDLTILPGKAAPGAASATAWENLGEAANVGIEVRIAGNKPAKLIEPSGTPAPIEADVQAATDSAIYIVQGRMVKDGEDIGIGTVETTINFVANYK